MSFTNNSPDRNNVAVGEFEMEGAHIIGLAKRGKIDVLHANAASSK